MEAALAAAYRTATGQPPPAPEPASALSRAERVAAGWSYSTPLPPGILGADPKLAVPRMDLNKAKEWLAKSKYPNGGIKLTYIYVTGLEIERKFGLILLDSLKKLNIDLDIKMLVWPDMVALTKDPKTTPDFFPVFQTANYADPDNIAYAAYHGSQNGNWSNPTYNSPKANELIEKGWVTLAEAERIKIYRLRPPSPACSPWTPRWRAIGTPWARCCGT